LPRDLDELKGHPESENYARGRSILPAWPWKRASKKWKTEAKAAMRGIAITHPLDCQTDRFTDKRKKYADQGTGDNLSWG